MMVGGVLPRYGVLFRSGMRDGSDWLAHPAVGECVWGRGCQFIACASVSSPLSHFHVPFGVRV